MLTTVTLNAAIDKTYALPHYTQGKVNRIARLTADAGGKGINVARVATMLGTPCMATGFAGGYNGQFIMNELDRTGIAHDFVRVAEESRLCLSVLDESGEALPATELLEPGPRIGVADTEEMKRKLEQLAARSRIVSISGSLPAGAPETLYADLIGIAKRQGATVLLDTSGAALRCGMQAAPFMIKPNEDEAAALLGGSLPEGDGELLASLRRAAGPDIGCIIVSLGGRGAVVDWSGSRFRVISPTVHPVSTVGCGDAFVAGLASALLAGEPPEACLRLAAAAGAANALQMRAGCIDAGDVERLLAEVRVEPLDDPAA